MARCPNVWTDISGQFISGSSEDTPEYRQSIVEEIRKFLNLERHSERVAFATDFPIQSYADSLDLVQKLDLDNHARNNMLVANAIRIIDPQYTI